MPYCRMARPSTRCETSQMTHCGEYFSALHNLCRPSLRNINIQCIRNEQFHAFFSAFRGTLTEPSLPLFFTSFGMFVTLVRYFTNITPLQLGPLMLKPSGKPVPPFSGGSHALIGSATAAATSSVNSPSWTWNAMN